MSTHEVFISSALADEPYRRQLEKHLSVLKGQGLISLWHDGEIRPGTNTAETVDLYLDVNHFAHVGRELDHEVGGKTGIRMQRKEVKRG